MKNRKRIIIFLIVSVVVVGGVCLFRFFSEKGISPRVCGPDKIFAEDATATARAELTTVTEWYDAVGTVQPSTQARIEAQVPGQINEIRVNAGDEVKTGQLLIVLDDRRMRTRLSQARQSLQTSVAGREQARQAVNAARAAFEEAESAYNRVRGFYAAQATTEQSLEQARSRYQQAEAALRRSEDAVSGAGAGVGMAEEMVAEAEIALGYTRIEAPSDGRVLKRMADPGDQAMPGKPLLLLRTSGGLRLEAHVREGLIGQVRVGSVLRVELAALERTVDARVEEIIPYADPQSRTFLVKTALPDLPGLYPGMYGKLLMPYKKVDLVLVPPETIARVGQLELVNVKTPAGWTRRYIKTGHVYQGRVEVLSGLSGGEILKVKEPGNDE